jgi:hypothetical protein
MHTSAHPFIEALEERLNFSSLTITPLSIPDGTSNTVDLNTRKPAAGLRTAQEHTHGVIVWNPD